MRLAVWAAFAIALPGCRLLYESEPAESAPDELCDLPAPLLYTSTVNGHCYALLDTPQRWPLADSNCSAVGSHLVTFESQQELDDVVTGLSLGTSVWMGLGSMGGQLSWATSEPLVFTNWQSGEPPADVAGLAGILAPDGTWLTGDETLTLLAVCERSLERTADGTAFVKFDRSSTWDVARIDCEDRGGHLATIHSPQEAAAVAPLSAKPAWIGLNDQATEGQFEWVTAEPLTFEQFGSAEPNGGTAANCVSVKDGRWGDRPCSDSAPYICELSAP